MKHFLLVLAALFTASVAFAQIPELKPVKNLEDALVPTAKKDKWGYANERGKMIIKAVFDEAEPFMEVVDKDSTAMQMARIRIGEGWGYITREGIYLIEPLYDTISVFDSFATVVAKQGPSLILIGLRTGTSNKHDIPVPVSNVLEVNLSEITPFAEDGTAWAKRAGKWGIIDNFGKWIVPCRYDSWSEIASCNGYLVTENGMRSFINRKGEVVIDPGNWTADVEALRKYEYVKWDESLPGFFVSIEDKNDILDPAGNSVIGLGRWTAGSSALMNSGYDLVRWSEPLDGFVMQKNGLLGRLNADGTVLYPCLFDAVPDVQNRGWEEVFIDGEPSIYIRGDKAYSVKEYDEILYKQLSAKEYVESPMLPYFFKSYLNRVFAPQEEDATDYDYCIPAVRVDIESMILSSSFPGGANVEDWKLSDGRSVKEVLWLIPEEEDYQAFWEDEDYIYLGEHSGYEQYHDVRIYNKSDRTLKNVIGVQGNYFASEKYGFVGEDYEIYGGGVTDKFVDIHLTHFSDEGVVVPILRYHYGEWAGVPMVFIDNNNVLDLDNFTMPLSLIKENTTYQVGFVSTGEDGSGLTQYLRVGQAVDGIATYEILTKTISYDYNTWERIESSPVTVAYGVIGLGKNFFTEPLFESRPGRGTSLQELKKQDPFIQPKSEF